MLNILKAYERITKLLESIEKGAYKSASINQMTMIMLIHRGRATTVVELSKLMKKEPPTIRKIGYSLGNGRGAGNIVGFNFIKTTPVHEPGLSGKPRNKYALTTNGKKFARIIAKAFGD